MAYRRYRSYGKPTKRCIEVKYPAPCACCGAIIRIGELADYYPVGTIAGVHEARISHMGGLDANSGRCALNLREKLDANTNDYAGDGLDVRYEDECAARCGL